MHHTDITALLEYVINASPDTLLALRYIRDLCTGEPTLRQAIVRAESAWHSSGTDSD